MMRRIVFVFFLAVSMTVTANATDGKYAVSGIAPSLRTNADAVIRLQEIRFEIKGLKETRQTDHYVITVLNEKGDQWAEFYRYYDNFQSIISAEGYLYDPSGKMLRRVRKKDMKDYKASDGSFADDNRVKIHNFYQRSYPYTIEYTVETSNKTSFYFPQWNPRPGCNISVEKSTMAVISPVDYDFRYKAFLYDGVPDLATQKNQKITSWSVTDLPAVLKEPFAPLWQEISPMIFFAPCDFQMGGYKGNMQTWESFGRFLYALNTGRDQLPDDIRKDVHLIADSLQDPVQKVRALYEYMQRNTHYVSVQLGIGGWQPFDAKYVATNRYGDCKALSNYMYSLLKEAGINSFYTLVYAARNEPGKDIVRDFPSPQFNHVILCVPLAQDTVWLECTSQTLPAGYLSDFTAGRSALLVTGTGGKLVRTPRYGVGDNTQVRRVQASLLNDGDLRISATTVYRGLLQDEVHSLINDLSPEKVRDYLQGQMDFATYKVDRFDYKEEKSAIPSVMEMLDISVDHYATVTGRRLFIVPNIMERSSLKLSTDSVRIYPVELGIGYSSVDSVVIDLPDGYTTESLPADLDLSTPFGTYRSSTVIKNGKVYYYRRMEQFGGRFPASAYGEVVKFYEGVYKGDRGRIVLLKN